MGRAVFRNWFAYPIRYFFFFRHFVNVEFVGEKETHLPFFGECCPIEPQGIAFDNVGVVGKWQKFNVLTQNGFGFANHLAFGNPKGGFGHGYCKIVYLNPIELIDFNTDKIVEAQQPLAFVQ